MNESVRLIKYLVTCTPHQVNDTISLNNSRNIVIYLSKPLAEIGQLIQENIKLNKKRQKELENSNQTKQIIDQDFMEEILEKYKKKVDELQKEQQKINELSLKFAQFLRQNSITAFNDTYAEYLDHFIREEKFKKSNDPINYDNEILEELEIRVSILMQLCQLSG